MSRRWEETAANDLKAVLRRAGLTYEDMASLLTKAGEPTTKLMLGKKINRGTFQHAFYMFCVHVIDEHIAHASVKR